MTDESCTPALSPQEIYQAETESKSYHLDNLITQLLQNKATHVLQNTLFSCLSHPF